MENIETPEIEILNFLNQVVAAPRGFRPIKSNLNGISSLFKDGFTKEEIIEVIQLKTIQWKNNPQMAYCLRPSTLFRSSNFENYIVEVSQIKSNPKLYEKYFSKLTKSTRSAADDADALEAMYG